jgi:integrase/recombinase XerD
MQVRFKHLVEDRDRHGNVRVYVRVPGRRKVRIKAIFGTMNSWQPTMLLYLIM